MDDKNCCVYEKAAEVGQDKPVKDFTEVYDRDHGKYADTAGGKPVDGSSGPLPNTKSPFGG